MAEVVLQKHYITSGIMDGVHVTGNYIFVIADGSTIFHRVYTDSEGINLVATPSGGPTLNSEILVSSGTFNNYQYCSGSDLVYYQPQDDWPYANYNLSVDHPSCAIVVCDLEITGFTVTNESASGAADGEVALTSISSNGTVKYSLIEDFNYTTQGQASPITGLGTGNYTIYAKDAAGCTDSVTVFVGLEVTYGPRWRMDYNTMYPTMYSRVDIEELEYAGAVTEICGGPIPFRLEYGRGAKSDSQLVPSVAQIELLCETDGQFDDIRQGHDRQFRIRKYKGADVGSLVLDWTGFISPEFYEEPYLNEPYIVRFEATDGLKELENKDFVALSGEEFFGDMSLIQIIAECLKKIPTQINIRSCVNIFEQNHATTAADDPLAQTYEATQRYRGMKCEEVLSSILKPFTRSELFQSFGVWWIRTKEQSVYSTLAYREFDTDGVYSSNSTISSRKNLDFPTNSNRMNWIQGSQRLSYSRNYGTFRVIHDLDKDNNMIDSGGFEQEDLSLTDEFFRGWNIFPAQENVSYGLEFIKNNSSKGAFFFQWSGTSGAQADNELSTQLMRLQFPTFASTAVSFKLKLQVYVSRQYQINWYRLGIRLRWVNNDDASYQDVDIKKPSISGTENVTFVNDVYVTQFENLQTIEVIGIRPPTMSIPGDFTLQLSFFFHDHMGRDYNSIAGLKAAATTSLQEGKRVYVTEDATDPPTYGFELRRTTQSETGSYPFDIVIPNDHNAVTNPVGWFKIDEFNIDKDVRVIDRLLIDNVEINIFSRGIIAGQAGEILIDPPETVEYEQEITANNESVFEDEVSNGDAPEITGTEYIYNGYFKLSDGTVTSRWARSGVSESTRLLSILLNHLVAQGSQSLRILDGTIHGDIQVGYINSLEDQRDDRRYRFTRFSIDDKRGEIACELEETLTGADGESPPEAGGNFRIIHTDEVRETNTGDLRIYV